MKKLTFIFTAFLGTFAIQDFEWTIPFGLDDGVYGIYFDEFDTDMADPKFDRINYIEQIKNVGPASRSLPERRPGDTESLVYDHHSTPPIEMPVSSQGCTKSRTPLDPDEHWAAKQRLYYECDRGRRVHRYWGEVATNGTAVVWVCSCLWLGFRNPCPLQELYAAEGIFNHTCGDDKGAWVHMKKWRKSYGRGTKGHKITCPCWK